MVKKLIKRIFPKTLVSIIARIIQAIDTYRFYVSDRKRFLKYSGIFCNSDSQTKLIGKISMAYHGIEKGLTMPDKRLGFGSDAILNLIELCNLYIDKNYDTLDNQFLHAIGVLDEYKREHDEKNFVLPSKLLEIFNKLLLNVGGNFPKTKQIQITRDQFFKEINSSFDNFSNSRHSVRHFISGINISSIHQAIELAQNAPSSCNRQSPRVHIIQDRNTLDLVLSLQMGNRGFGHLADKIIIVTSEIGIFSSARERNAGYVDGGIFGMNLLYALHFNRIGVCTLNSYFSTKTERKMRKVCKIPESEIFVMILLLGNIPDSFAIALSKRQERVKIMSII